MNQDPPTIAAAVIAIVTIFFLFFRSERHRKRADYCERVATIMSSAYLKLILNARFPDGLPKNGVELSVSSDGSVDAKENDKPTQP